MNAFKRVNFELILQYKSFHEQDENGPDKEVSTTEDPYCFQKSGQLFFIILNLSFTHNRIFLSEYFQDRTKMTLSFKTEQYCTHV